MKGSALFGAALCAWSALATPIDRRVVVVTDVELTVVTVTVTESPTSLAVSTTSTTTTPSPVSATSTTAAISSVSATSTPVTEAALARVNNDMHPVSSSTSESVFSSSSSWSTSTSAEPTTTSIATSSSTTSKSTSTSSSATATATATSAYQAMVIEAHNIHRANHSASDLIWNSTLAESALALANTCNYGHNTDLGPAANYGQNIAFGVAAADVDEIITNMMYNDEMMNYEGLYGEASPSMSDFDSWGHFSQIVWVDTTSVGCATVTCDPLGNSGSSMSLPFTVCNYYPAGNYAGEYGDNVLKPLGDPMVVASS
ncbi:hypothetical protein UA08_08857 [Talaromyces atroroseus]|uniref:SCP domain-containing protein n=1 Tax=Talaromyces atroroseus TaxID=1441469 RepID=A0A225AAS0_TALAT|nr:hypothetical protein UA08_08857 [Talaromyces atroroseus]OKL55793.1 hypothetical protein UA08_08857 [Talaromyces atroroseus]